MLEINAKNKRVLLISDQHFPYHHRDTHKFLEAIRDKYLTPYDIIINGGDEVDNHAISFHPSDGDLPSAGDELDKAIRNIQHLEELFPEMYLCDSNHGSLAVRRFKFHGIPLRYLKSLNDIYGVNSNWKWNEDYLLKTKLGDVYICHGKSSVYGKLSKEVGCSAIQFHFHGKYEITWHSTVLGSRFNMFCGCLVDRDSLAMAYGKNHIPKPILGVGLISKDGIPALIKMNLDKKNRWDGKLP